MKNSSVSSSSDSNSHLTSSAVMVRPIDFGYNEQTGLDNEFQHRPAITEMQDISTQVNCEFDSSIKTLSNLGIEILILKKEHTDNLLPDAIFPNNWFSTQQDGKLVIYPMKTKNRQDEVQILQLSNLLTQFGYQPTEVIDLRIDLLKDAVLEGTGSLIFHHPSNRIFASISERCQTSALVTFAEEFSYRLIKFNSSSLRGKAIYHTNVLMSCGKNFTVVTKSVISKADKKRVMDELSNSVNDIVTISEQQMSEHFCGNILQLQDASQQPIIAMSTTAYQGFKPQQRKILEKHGSLAICAIPTIERIGGGSIRCMLAENFLVKI